MDQGGIQPIRTNAVRQAEKEISSLEKCNTPPYDKFGYLRSLARW
jgi:hypothetical protein